MRNNPIGRVRKERDKYVENKKIEKPIIYEINEKYIQDIIDDLNIFVENNENYNFKLIRAINNLEYIKRKIIPTKICGKTIEEIIPILNGLDLERTTGILMTMSNLNQYQNLINEEIKNQFRNHFEKVSEGDNE